METREAILKRKSVRDFDPGRTVDERAIRSILELGIRAPSAGNLQPWKIFVVRKPETKRALAGAAFGQRFVSAAPVVLVVCADRARAASGYGRRGSELYCIQDTAALTENILLAAVDFGLGTCWVGAFDEARCTEALGIHDELRPVAIVPVGYAAGNPAGTGRRPLDEIAVWD